MIVKMALLRESDLEMIMEWRMRPYITEYMNTDPELTLEGQKAWYDKIKNGGKEFNWIIQCDGVPVGLIRIMDIDRTNSRCSWGYYVAEKSYRSLKLALNLEWSLYDFVFDVLKLHKLCNETFAENQRVIKLHTICGSKVDGILRQHIYKNGVYHDISVGSIIADEWFSRRETVQYDRYYFEMGPDEC